MSNDHPDLSRALRDQAGRVTPGHPLSLSDVKHRAGAIRRRRVATTGAVAATLVALAVPVGLALEDPGASDRSLDPAAPTQRVAPTTPETPREGVLTNTVAATSDPAGIGYLLDGSLVRTDGSRLDLAGDYTRLVPLGDGYVGVEASTAEVTVLDGEGRVTSVHPSTGDLAGSPDATLVAWGTEEGQVLTLAEGGDPVALTADNAPTEPVLVGGVQGSEGCAEADCTVWFTSAAGTDPSAGSVSSGGRLDTLPLRTVDAVSADGWVSGSLSVSDTGSCSAVVDGRSGAERWRTCEHTLGSFSPDGRYVLGGPAYLDGAGDAEVAILDAASGTVLADWSSTRRTQALLGAAVWDTDGTVLATVFEGDHYAIMRFSPDGSLSTVVPDVGGAYGESPVTFAALD